MTTNQRPPPKRRVRPRRRDCAAAGRWPTSPAPANCVSARSARDGEPKTGNPTPPQRLHRQRLNVHAAMDAAGQPTRQRATRVRQPAVTTACGLTAHSPPTASQPAVPSPRGNNRRPTTSQPASTQRRDRPRRKDPAAVTANRRPSDQPTHPPSTASPPAVPSWRAPRTSADRVDTIEEKGEDGQHADDRRGKGFLNRGWL